MNSIRYLEAILARLMRLGNCLRGCVVFASPRRTDEGARFCSRHVLKLPATKLHPHCKQVIRNEMLKLTEVNTGMHSVHPLLT
jgi:hypothetical protein